MSGCSDLDTGETSVISTFSTKVLARVGRETFLITGAKMFL